MARSVKLLDASGLTELRARNPGRKIAHCHGVFDLLHVGHLAYFEAAKKSGDLLVVTVTDDPYVNKGPGRPRFKVDVRARMIAALEVVDFVSISRHATAVACIEALKPDFYVKGPDYRDKSKDATGGIVLEEAAVRRVGGRLVITDTDSETHSSTELLREPDQSKGRRSDG